MFEDATSPEFASMMAGTQALPWEQQEGHPLNRMDNAAARTFIMSLLKCVGHYPIIFSELALGSVPLRCLCVAEMQQQDSPTRPICLWRPAHCPRPASVCPCSFLKR